MIIFGIVSEYNPLHSGHIYQINRIKKQFPDAYIISITSSSFVQRGEPSFISKHFKSKLAIENGVDLFLEMPTIISIQSANLFSFYSIKLLNKLNILDYISFGVESLDCRKIYRYLDFEEDNTLEINDSVKKYLDQGYSYKKANELTLTQFYPESVILSKPNNTLAIEYSRALRRLKSNIMIYPINRLDNSYHNKELDSSEFQSATAIRKAILEEKDVSDFIPFDVYDAGLNIDFEGINKLNDAFYYKAFIEESKGSNIAGYEEGILNLLMSNFNSDIDDMIEKSHNKRYSKARLERFIINYLLDIKKTDIKNLEQINYIRPLAFNDKGRKLLKMIKESSDIQVITKAANINELDDINKSLYDIDLKAFRLYNINNPNRNIEEFTHNPYIG